MLRRRRHALLPHRLPRGALLQGAARRDLRPRLLPERDHLGLRLRRAREAPLAGQARHDPRLRQGPGAPTSSTPTRSTASRTWRRASSARRRRRAGSCRPTSGGTRSSRRPAREKTGYPTQKPLGVLRRIVPPRRAPGDCASTSSPAAARSAPPRSSSAAGRCSATRAPRRCAVMRDRLGLPFGRRRRAS